MIRFSFEPHLSWVEFFKTRIALERWETHFTVELTNNIQAYTAYTAYTRTAYSQQLLIWQTIVGLPMASLSIKWNGFTADTSIDKFGFEFVFSADLNFRFY
jgi:hypothetical protein